MNLREELLNHQDLQYKEFQKKLVPNVDENTIIGIRLPMLRKIAKQAFQENAENRLEYYEEIMVYGFTLGLKKATLEEHIADLKTFVPLINNWAVCDSCCSSFKFTNQYKNELYDFIVSYINKSEFETRFAIVMLMDYYLTDEYIDGVLSLLKHIQSEEYYVNMAVAWALSVAYVKYRNATLKILEEKCLSADVQNKTIQKIKDSFRVTKEDKIYLTQLKMRLHQ